MTTQDSASTPRAARPSRSTLTRLVAGFPVRAGEEPWTVAEVEEIVEVGDLEPDLVHTPSIYVQRLIQGERYEKWIEQRTTRAG